VMCIIMCFIMFIMIILPILFWQCVWSAIVWTWYLRYSRLTGWVLVG